MKIASIRVRIFEILEKGKKGDIKSIFFDYFIIILISLNIGVIVLESFENINYTFSRFFNFFELLSITIFTIEYILRLLTADLKIKSRNKFNSVVLFIIKPLSLVDLIAILPFYMPMIIPLDLRIIRVLRLIRMIRLLKIKRYSRSLEIIGKVFKEKSQDLLITIFVTFLLLLFASTLMYYIEHEIQPENFSNIIQSLWWAVATLTTVGYGDVFPVTGMGKFLSGIIALLGIGLVALPTGIISSGFIEELGNQKKECTCPHCGKLIE